MQSCVCTLECIIKVVCVLFGFIFCMCCENNQNPDPLLSTIFPFFCKLKWTFFIKTFLVSKIKILGNKEGGGSVVWNSTDYSF